MFNRSPLVALTILRNRKETNLFSHLPKELIREISQFIETPNSDFTEALHYVAYGELDKAKALLEANPRLIFFAGTVVTPAGLTIKRTTLLECALGSGDPKMIAMIMPYFSQFEGGEEERKRQLARYEKLIKELPNQKPDDLTWLIDIIKKSNASDVAAELATGEHYDKNYQSPLRDALNKFRKEKLDPSVRVITEPRMHCNYQNFIHAVDILYTEWKNLIEGINYDKFFLVVNQIVGFIELIELPAYERFVCAHDEVANAKAGKEIERSFNYKYMHGSFPSYNASLINARSGLGFDSFVDFYGREGFLGGLPLEDAHHARSFAKFVSSKNSKLEKLMQQSQPKMSSCVIC